MRNILGLSSILLWQWLTVLEGRLFPSLFQKGVFGPGGGYIFFSLVLCATFFFFARWGKLLPERWFALGMWGAGGLMAFAWAPGGAFLRQLPLAGPVLFLALPAVGSAYQLTGWEWRLSRSPFSFQALSFGSACALRTGMILLVPLLFPALLRGVALGLPFIGAFLWKPPEAVLSSGSPRIFLRRRFFAFPPSLIFRVTALFGASAIFAAILLAHRGDVMGMARKISDPLYSLGALGVGGLLYRFPGLDLRSAYPLAQGFLGLGFLLFGVFGTTHPLVPLGLLQLGFGIFGAYIFMLLLYLGSRAERREALRVVASGQLVVSGAMLLGMVFAEGMGILCSLEEIPFVLGASLGGMGILFFSELLFRDETERFAGYDLEGPEEAGEEEIPREDRLHLQLLREGLSGGEIRVALLVAQGHTNGAISQELNITANTLRSHLKKIHKKMGSRDRKTLREELERRREGVPEDSALYGKERME